MKDFLETMRLASAARWAEARGREPELRRRAADAPAPRPVDTDRFGIIAELKRVSPAEGDLGEERSPAERARLYAAGGAVMLSVLTEPLRFGGSLEDLEQVAGAVELPAMRKDFLVHPGQVLESRAHGASAVLLIAELLDDGALDEMLDAARAHSMTVLLESFSMEELRRVLDRCDDESVLCGVNCRDLRDLSIDLARFERAGEELRDRVWVAESGVKSVEDLERVARCGCRLVLCGTALMRSGDPEIAVREFTERGRRCA